MLRSMGCCLVDFDVRFNACVRKEQDEEAKRLAEETSHEEYPFS